MTAIKSQHSRIFESLMAAHRETLVGSLVQGIPLDHPAYRQLVGQIQGVDTALELSRQADSKLSGEEPDASG